MKEQIMNKEKQKEKYDVYLRIRSCPCCEAIIFDRGFVNISLQKCPNCGFELKGGAE